jgi:uncharacterized protein YkwD
VSRPSQGDAALERQIHELVNRYRKERGLKALTIDARISEQARRHSVAMATGRAPLGHQGFEDRIRALRQVMTVGLSAENAGMQGGYATPAERMVADWLASGAHRVNIEGQYDFTGIGVARDRAGRIYFTQIFTER